jgi:hypothetical protein
MHDHPASQVVYLTDVNANLPFQAQRPRKNTGRPARRSGPPRGKHLPENLNDKPLEGILVELKGKPAKSK